MADYRDANAAIAQFEESCRLGQLVDDTGLVRLPPLLADWTIYVDGEKADRVPADNRDHLIELRGPDDCGHMETNARVKPPLRVVR